MDNGQQNLNSEVSSLQQFDLPIGVTPALERLHIVAVWCLTSLWVQRHQFDIPNAATSPMVWPLLCSDLYSGAISTVIWHSQRYNLTNSATFQMVRKPIVRSPSRTQYSTYLRNS